METMGGPSRIRVLTQERRWALGTNIISTVLEATKAPLPTIRSWLDTERGARDDFRVWGCRIRYLVIIYRSYSCYLSNWMCHNSQYQRPRQMNITPQTNGFWLRQQNTFGGNEAS